MVKEPYTDLDGGERGLPDPFQIHENSNEIQRQQRFRGCCLQFRCSRASNMLREGDYVHLKMQTDALMILLFSLSTSPPTLDHTIKTGNVEILQHHYPGSGLCLSLASSTCCIQQGSATQEQRSPLDRRLLTTSSLVEVQLVLRSLQDSQKTLRRALQS
jgi:hypothetical protein